MKALNKAIAPLSACAGIITAVIAAAAMTHTSPETREALLRYQELPPGEVRRLHATFDRLQASADDLEKTRAIHEAVRQDSGLDGRLREFYAWWMETDPDQRLELQYASDEEWAELARRSMAAPARPPGVAIRVAGQRRTGDDTRIRETFVTLDRLELIFRDVLPDDQLNNKERALLDGISDQDRLLTLALIAADRLSPNGRRPTGQDSEALANRFSDSIVQHLEPQSPLRRLVQSANDSVRKLACAAVLRAVIDHFGPGFLDRISQSTAELVAKFDELNPTERERLMSIDPSVAATTLRAQLMREKGEEFNVQLAERLFQFQTRIRRFLDREIPVRGNNPPGRPGRDSLDRKPPEKAGRPVQ